MNPPNIAGMSGIPAVPKDSIPRVIGTEVNYLYEGKIYVGLIRSFNSDGQTVIVQYGNSTTRIVAYAQIVSINAPKELINEFERTVSVSVRLSSWNKNRTEIHCGSVTSHNINGVFFYENPIANSDNQWRTGYWHDRANNYINLLP